MTASPEVIVGFLQLADDVRLLHSKHARCDGWLYLLSATLGNQSVDGRLAAVHHVTSRATTHHSDMRTRRNYCSFRPALGHPILISCPITHIVIVGRLGQLRGASSQVLILTLAEGGLERRLRSEIRPVFYRGMRGVVRCDFVKWASSSLDANLHGLVQIERTVGHGCRHDALLTASHLTHLLLPFFQILNASHLVEELNQAALRVVLLLKHSEASLEITRCAPLGRCKSVISCS